MVRERKPGADMMDATMSHRTKTLFALLILVQDMPRVPSFLRVARHNALHPGADSELSGRPP